MDKQGLELTLEEMEAQKKKKLLRWDPKKRKFVKVSVEFISCVRVNLFVALLSIPERII